MTKKYKSDASAAIHEMMVDLHEVGAIDKQTMRKFDESCLTPIHEFTADEIRALREREEVSQTVFARYLGVSKDSVSQWERGQKKPIGAALKLLSLVESKGLFSVAQFLVVVSQRKLNLPFGKCVDFQCVAQYVTSCNNSVT